MMKNGEPEEIEIVVCCRSYFHLDRLNTACDCPRCKEVRREDEQKRHKYKGRQTRYRRARRWR